MGNTNKVRALGYIQGLVLRIGRANCTNLVKRVGGSHDSLTKLLNTAGIDWPSILMRAMFKIFGTINGGYLIIDETTIDKTYAKIIEGCHWLWSSKESMYVFGYHVTLLLWSNGTLTVPIGLRVYKKADNKKDQVTAIDLAIELLEYAKKYVEN